MPRVKVHIKAPTLFFTDLRVRITDLNYGNHLANDKVLSMIHEARVRFFNELGYGETDIEGLGIIMSDAEIEYKNQGFYNDLIRIEITIDNLHKKGFDFFYKLENTHTGKIIARIKTAIIFFDYSMQKPSVIPQKFLAKIEALRQNVQ